MQAAWPMHTVNRTDGQIAHLFLLKIHWWVCWRLKRRQDICNIFLFVILFRNIFWTAEEKTKPKHIWAVSRSAPSDFFLQTSVTVHTTARPLPPFIHDCLTESLTVTLWPVAMCQRTPLAFEVHFFFSFLFFLVLPAHFLNVYTSPLHFRLALWCPDPEHVSNLCCSIFFIAKKLWNLNGWRGDGGVEALKKVIRASYKMWNSSQVNFFNLHS